MYLYNTSILILSQLKNMSNRVFEGNMSKKET